MSGVSTRRAADSTPTSVPIAPARAQLPDHTRWARILARALAPRMAARGRGHLLVTASAAGLLTNMDSAPYSVTKHGTVALAEWLAIRWGDAGVGVSCLCPQGVRTAMTEGMGPGSSVLAAGALLDPAAVA